MPGFSGIGAVGGIGSVAGFNPANFAQVGQVYARQRARIDAAGEAAAAGVVSPAAGVAQAAAARGTDFAKAVGNGLSSLEAMDRTASTKAVQAATGDLNDVHDYVIAATKLQTATELTTTVRNKALEAFNEIMRMPL